MTTNLLILGTCLWGKKSDKFKTETADSIFADNFCIAKYMKVVETFKILVHTIIYMPSKLYAIAKIFMTIALII